jgi:hypothetical protein
MAEVASGAEGVASKPERSAGRCEGSNAYSMYWFTANCIGSTITFLMRTFKKAAANPWNLAASQIEEDIWLHWSTVVPWLTDKFPYKRHLVLGWRVRVD